MSWAEEELKYADLGDSRRNRRLVTIVEDLCEHPNATVPQAVRDNAALQGIYEFWANRRIKAEDILAAHSRQTCERIKNEPQILLIQDTTELDYSKYHKQGMGGLSGDKRKGLKVHSTLCVNLQGVPQGILGQKVWASEKIRCTQDSASYKEKKKAVKERESQRWLDSLEHSQKQLPENVTGITVADREADIFRLLAQHHNTQSDYIIRATKNRRYQEGYIDENGQKRSVWDFIHQQPIQQVIDLDLQRTPRRKKPRHIQLSLRYSSIELRVPTESGLPENERQPLTIQVLLAAEIEPPPQEKPVVWMLLTSLPLDNETQAQQCLELYSYRWLIERYHYTLKSGCQIEKLQLDNSERIIKALATYSIVAWRLLWLTYEARKNPQQSATKVLTEAEWQALYCLTHKKKLTSIAQLPKQPPSLRECVRWIAQLGGFLGRKSDGEPGVKTLWRGLQRLEDITCGWLLS
jgi:hypothetical protein